MDQVKKKVKTNDYEKQSYQSNNDNEQQVQYTIYEGVKYNLEDINIDLDYENDIKAINESSVLLIRHALSQFNYDIRIKQFKMKLENVSKEEKEEIHHQMYQDSKYADSKLHDLGIIQAQNQVKISHQIKNIKYIFISPLRRVLQTIEILFKDHPDKKNIKFVVIPQLTESIGWSTSVPVDTLNFIKQVAKNNDFDINTEILEKQTVFENDKLRFWAIKQLIDEKEKQEILDFMVENKYSKEMLDSEVVELLLQKYEQYFPKKIEMGSDVQERGNRARKTIKEYLQKVGITPSSDSKIIIVSHAMFLSFFTCKSIENNDKPIDGIRCKNAQFKPYDEW